MGVWLWEAAPSSAGGSRMEPGGRAGPCLEGPSPHHPGRRGAWGNAATHGAGSRAAGTPGGGGAAHGQHGTRTGQVGEPQDRTGGTGGLRRERVRAHLCALPCGPCPCARVCVHAPTCASQELSHDPLHREPSQSLPAQPKHSPVALPAWQHSGDRGRCAHTCQEAVAFLEACPTACMTCAGPGAAWARRWLRAGPVPRGGTTWRGAGEPTWARLGRGVTARATGVTVPAWALSCRVGVPPPAAPIGGSPLAHPRRATGRAPYLAPRG